MMVKVDYVERKCYTCFVYPFFFTEITCCFVFLYIYIYMRGQRAKYATGKVPLGLNSLQNGDQ
jgi:hypothetical protein